MLLRREIHIKDALLLFISIRVIAVHARQQSPGASHGLRLSHFWLSRTLKFLLPLVVIGTAVSRLNILFQAALHLHHKSIHTQIHTYIDAYTQMHIHRYPYTYIDAHMNTHTYTHHIHANIHTYTLYTYIQIQWNGFLMHLCDADVIHRHTPLQNITNTYFPF